jgi:hypothetical protein
MWAIAQQVSVTPYGRLTDCHLTHN